MPADRRVSFREDKSRSGSSRSSTLRSDSGAGSSSTGSSYPGTQYPERYDADPLYEVNALRQALQDSVKDVDKWRNKAYEVEKTLRKELGEANSHVKGVENHCNEVEEQHARDTKEIETLKARVASVQLENEELKQKYDKLKKKVEKQSSKASSTPETGKPQRSESKRSKDSDSDKEKSRLKERFVPRNENTSETSSSKRSTSKAPRNRRMSTTAYATDRPVYVEPYGQPAPRPTVMIPSSSMATGGRRPESYVATSKTGYPAVSPYQDPVYSSTPRSAGIDRPVSYQYPDAPMSPSMSYEDGNYHAHPLPPRR